MDYTTVRILAKGIAPNGNQIAAFLDLEFDNSGALTCADFTGILGVAGEMRNGRWVAHGSLDPNEPASPTERSTLIVEPFGAMTRTAEQEAVLVDEGWLSEAERVELRAALREYVENLHRPAERLTWRTRLARLIARLRGSLDTSTER